MAVVHPKTLKEARQARTVAGVAFLLVSVLLLLLSALPILLDADTPDEAQIGGWIGWLALLVGVYNADVRYKALKREAEAVDGDGAPAEATPAA